jgi:hypothetical protein
MCGRRDLGRLQTWLSRLGVPTLIVWIGSDVPRHATYVSKTAATRAWHWTVAPWLQREIAEAGIAAEVIPLTPPPIPAAAPPLPEEFSVLAYTADGRSDLYGLDFTLELARKRPDIPFVLLGATPSDSFPENIRAIRSVDDIRAILRGTTVYVRPTPHDGLSNLVLETLAHGRYVLWTFPFPSVEPADTVDGAAARLADLHRRHLEGLLRPNHDGRDAVVEMFGTSAIRRQVLGGLKEVAAQGWRIPPSVPARGISRVALDGLRLLLQADRAWEAGSTVRERAVQTVPPAEAEWIPR